MRTIFLKVFFFLFLFVIILVSIHWRSASEDNGFVSWEDAEQWNNKEIGNEFQAQPSTSQVYHQVSVFDINVTSSPISMNPSENLSVQANVTAGSSYETQSTDAVGSVDWTLLTPVLEKGSNRIYYDEQENTAKTSITSSYLASSFQLETGSTISAIRLGFNNSQELNMGQKSFTVYLSPSLTEYSSKHMAKWDVDTSLWDYTNFLDTKDMVLHHSDKTSPTTKFVSLSGNMTYYVILSSSSMIAIDTRVKDQESVRNISTSTDGMVWEDLNSDRELDITLLSTNIVLNESIEYELDGTNSTLEFSASGLEPGDYIAYVRYVENMDRIAPSFGLVYIQLVAAYVYNSSLEVTNEGNPSNFEYYDLVKISGNVTHLNDSHLPAEDLRLVIQYRQIDTWIEITKLNSSEQGTFEVQWRLQVVGQIVIRVYNEGLVPANKTIEVGRKQVKLWTDTVVQARYRNNNETTAFNFQIEVKDLMDEDLSEELLDLIELRWQLNDQIGQQESSSGIIKPDNGLFSFTLQFELDVGTHSDFLGITVNVDSDFSLEEQVNISLIVEKGDGQLQVTNNTGDQIDREIRWEGSYNVSGQILNFSLTTNNETITNISINGSIHLTENPDSPISLGEAVNNTLTIDFKSLVSQHKLQPETNYTLQLHFNNSRYETDLSFNFTMLYPEVSLILNHNEVLEAEYGDTINITLQVNDLLFNNALEGIEVEASIQLINGSQVTIKEITNQSGFVLFSIQLYVHVDPFEAYTGKSLMMMFQTSMGSSIEGITYSESQEKVLTVEILEGDPGIYFASADYTTIYAGDRFTLNLKLFGINILSTHSGTVILWKEYNNGTSVEIGRISVLEFVRDADCDVFNFTHYEEYVGEYTYVANLTGNGNWKVKETRLPMMIMVQKGELLLDLQVDKRLQPKVEHPMPLGIYWNTSNSSQIRVNREIQSVNLTIYLLNSPDEQKVVSFTATGSKNKNKTEVMWTKLPSLRAGNYNVVITVEEVGDGWNTIVLKYQVSVGYYLRIQQELNVTGNSINYLEKINVTFTIKVLEGRGAENLSQLPEKIELLIITGFEEGKINVSRTVTLQKDSLIYKGDSFLIYSELVEIGTGFYEIYAILKNDSAGYFQLEYEKEMIEIKALDVSLSSDTEILVEAMEETNLTLNTDMPLYSNISVEVSYMVEKNVETISAMVTNGTLQFPYISMDSGERQITVSSMDPWFNLNETLDVRVYSQILSLNVSIVSGEYQLVNDGIQFEFQIINQDGELENIDLHTIVRLTHLSDEGDELEQTIRYLEERQRELTFSPQSAGTYKIAIELKPDEIDGTYSKYIYPGYLDFQVKLRPINVAQREYEEKVSIYFTDGIREADIPIQNITVMIDERENGFLIRSREVFSESGVFNFSYPHEGVEYSITLMFAGNNIYQSVESTLHIEGAGINSMQTQSLQQSNISSMDSNTGSNQIYATIGLGIAAVIILMVTPPVIKKIVNKRGKRRD